MANAKSLSEFAFISLLNGEQKPSLKGAPPPIQLDSAEPVPLEHFSSLKVLCYLPMSHPSHQRVTFLVGIIIHNAVKGK